MKNEAGWEYQSWKDAWNPSWGEFDENTIDYAYQRKSG